MVANDVPKQTKLYQPNRLIAMKHKELITYHKHEEDSFVSSDLKLVCRCWLKVHMWGYFAPEADVKAQPTEVSVWDMLDNSSYHPRQCFKANFEPRSPRLANEQLLV